MTELEERILVLLERAPNVPRSPVVLAWALGREGLEVEHRDVTRALKRLRMRGYVSERPAYIRSSQREWVLTRRKVMA